MYLCIIFKSVLKSIFSIISAAGFRKKYKQGSAVCVKTILLHAVLQSWNFDPLSGKTLN